MEAFSKVGTPLYMSPEVLRGNGYEVSNNNIYNYFINKGQQHI